MELRDYIEAGEEKIGGRVPLAGYLQQDANVLSTAKSGKRGLPMYACVKLAELIGVSEIEVIAASELVTEKKPERRAIWSPFVQGTARHALGLALIAFAINFATPSPAQAAQNLNTKVIRLCIMSNRLTRLIAKIKAKLASVSFEFCKPGLPRRVCQVQA